MCGIAGFLDSSARSGPETLETIVSRMRDTLSHRGPDDAGAWVDATAGIALGHRRLSILDLSPEGHQPMFSPEGRWAIVFNGEIYNFLELRKELEEAGFVFRGHSDTEVMLAAVCRWGVEKAVQRFNGMFAFALWDCLEGELWLARDRLGKKPLYYGWTGTVFLFGSELKALRAHPEFRGRIDRGSLALYLRLGYIPSPYSIYEGIGKLAPGTLVKIRRDDRREVHAVYWSAQEAVERGLARPFRGSYGDAMNEVETLLRNAVKLRMIADVPLGAFLSGGIDSSLVVALMHLESSSPARTFSIGFNEPEHNEAGYARAVAKHLGSDHTELYATPEQATQVIPGLAKMYDEPFADSSQIPTYLVSWLTRRHVTVALSGDGGDELFGGYGAYLSNQRFHRKYGWLPPGIRTALAGILRRSQHPKLERLGGLLGFGSEEQIHQLLLSHWSIEDLDRDVAEPPTAFTVPSRRIRTDEFVERMMYLDAVTYLPDDILVKVDRASMAVALETRCPLLDYRVFEFAWRLPLGMKLKDGIGKRILRDLLYRRVPRELVDRPKRGFAVPVGKWIRGPLRPWAEELLSNSKLYEQGLIRPETVRRRWKRHLEGTEDATPALWTVLMLSAWLEEEKMPAGFNQGQLPGALAPAS